MNENNKSFYPLDMFEFIHHLGLTPKIPGPFLPISTSKMLKFSKKSPKNIKNKKMLKFQPHKDYDLLDLLK
jgi:hypothetical protein